VRLRTLGTRTHAVQPCAERTSVCAALRMSICSIVEVIVPASKVNRSARFTTGTAKTPPKWRTQEWHLSDAARAPSSQWQQLGEWDGCGEGSAKDALRQRNME